MREEMTSGFDPHSGAPPDPRHSLKEEFREIDERLRAMIDGYDEKPSLIDSGVLSAARNTVNVEAAISEAYRLMNARVYADNSPLRADGVVWRAFGEQRDEFITFYKSALRALEAFKNVLLAYNDLKNKPLRRGELERARRDEHVLGGEREACIEAVTNFCRKFSAMLTIL